MPSDEFSIASNVRVNGKVIQQGRVAALFRLVEELVEGDANQADASVAFRLENGQTRTLRSAGEIGKQIFDRNVLVTKIDLHVSSYEAGRRVYIGLDQQPLFLNSVWVSLDGEEGWVLKATSAIEAFLSSLDEVPKLGHLIGKLSRGRTGFWAPPVIGCALALCLVLGFERLMSVGLVAQGQLHFAVQLVGALLIAAVYVVFIAWMGRAYPELDIVIGKRELQVRRRDSTGALIFQGLSVGGPILGLIVERILRSL